MSDVFGFPPKVFIIGAQKSGTTQLSSLLDQHPEICLATPKEPDFFTRFFNKGPDWYKSKFTHPNKCLIDASTSYTCRPLSHIYNNDQAKKNDPFIGVPQRIHQRVPNAKLIYIVRDPINRAYSSYWHQVTAGYEQKSFLDALKNNAYYKRCSLYSEQLSYYLEYFDKKQILLLDFDDLIRRPKDVVMQCIDFIGLEKFDYKETEGHKNKSFQLPRFVSFINAHIFKVKPLLKFVRKFLPNILVSFITKYFTKSVPKISNEESLVATKYFEDEITKIRALLK